MHALARVWARLEEGLIAFLLAAMTLVTFVYVVLNNLYTLFYDLADLWEGGNETLLAIGDAILSLAQEMTWSNALTKALFAWLIFLGIAYGVRTAGHLGVDVLVKLASRPVQRVLGVIACLACLGYAGLLCVASYDWVKTLFIAGIGAEDLDHFGILQAYIAVVVPVGFGLVLLRYLEILVNLLPIAVSLGLSGALTILLFSPDSVRSLAIKLFETSEHYTLLAIPFFLLSGAFMTTGGVARRLIDFANACVGHIRGGLAIAAVLACMLFAALSGSSPATVAAVGSIAIAGMVRSGYPQAFGAGIVCNAGTLGILIPPSIVMVVYAAATETSVGKLFMAGVVPGLLLGLIYIVARVKKLPAMPRVSLREWIASARKALWGLLLMVIILGGIYSGAFTPTEAAAVAAVYSAFVALFVYKDMRLKECPKVLLESGKLTIMLMFIIANAMLFAHVLTTEQIPQSIAAWVTDLGLSPWMFLLVVNIVLLIAGNFMEPSAIILILAPIFFPIAMELGIDPIHLGIIMVVNMEIGLITPPVGLNLFVTSAVTGMPLGATIRAALPWLMILLVFLIIVTYIPAVSMALPNWLGMS